MCRELGTAPVASACTSSQWGPNQMWTLSSSNLSSHLRNSATNHHELWYGSLRAARRPNRNTSCIISERRVGQRSAAGGVSTLITSLLLGKLSNSSCNLGWKAFTLYHSQRTDHKNESAITEKLSLGYDHISWAFYCYHDSWFQFSGLKVSAEA
jgi:hypothetical protein